MVAAQAFHWFEPSAARRKFERILRPKGWVVLIGNRRISDARPFEREYELLLRTYGTDYAAVAATYPNRQRMAEFFGEGKFLESSTPNEQLFDFDGLRGRLLSSSYSPPEGHPNHAPMLVELKRLFDAHQQGGHVRFDYETSTYYVTLGTAMRIVYNWLKEFVEVTAPAAELRSRLSLAGIAIDSVEETAAGTVLDAEITANRPDCLGHYGIAREVAAIYRVPVKALQPKLKESSEKASDATRVDIEAPDLCGRYTARVLRGVKVQPSPEWLRQRLEAIGQKSINNVVDVTNYVMFELGQPMHAFDMDKLAEKRIVVRRARPGEKIRTLDGAERTLTKDMCVIADAARAVAIGGVMGGADSEIGFSSRNILLESAWFDPISVRRTSKALGLRTEASYRFERGADPEMAEMASRRAAELIQQLGGGEILAGVVDAYPRREAPIAIELSRRELLRVMGADIPDRDIEEILSALGFQPSRGNGNSADTESRHAVWQCERPSWRRDVTRGIDLIEEVARHYGYDKFPPRLPPAKRPAHRLPHAEALDRLRERVIALGYREIVAIPLVDARRDEIFRADGVAPAVIGNPLAEDASVMRSNGVVSMIGALEWNLNHGQRDLRLFEVGKAYELRDGEPLETPVLTLGATGLRARKVDL